MSPRATGYFITAAAILLVMLIAWLIRHRGRIASTLGDSSISVMAGAVRLGRRVGETKDRVAARVRDRLDNSPDATVDDTLKSAVERALDEKP